MPDKIKDKKELATNRLLEILRGDSAQETAPLVDEQLALSDEEQAALSGEVQVAGDTEPAPHGAEKLSIVHSLIDAILTKAQNIIKLKKGIIGIDIGSDSIKYVYCIKEKKNYIVKDIGIRKIEEHYTGDPKKKIENIKKAIDELISEELKKTSSIATTVFGPNVSIKKITLPKLQKKEMKDAIIWNAKKDLQFSGDDATFDYRILGKVEEQGIEKTEVLVAAAENSLINERIQFFNSLSIEPAKILAIPLSIYSNFLHFAGDPENSNGAVIDIGLKMTNIIFVQDGNLQFAREISIGGDDITEAMVGTLSGSDGVVKIDKEEAERLKFVYGIPPEDAVRTTEHGISLNQIASVMRPALERLLVQIQRSFDFYRTKFPYEEPDKVYLTGGTALLKNIKGFLAEGLNKDVEVLNPFKGVIVDQKLEEEKNVSEVAPSLAVAVGSVFSDAESINLLPQELKDKMLFAVQKKILSVAAAFIFFIMILMSVFVYSEFRSVSAQLTQLQTAKQPGDALQAQRMQFAGQINKLKNEQIADRQNFEAFAGTIQIIDYLKLLSTLTPHYIVLESVIVDLHESNMLNLLGRINVDISETEFFLSHYLRQLENSGLFLRVNPYTLNDPDESGIAQTPATTGTSGMSEESLTFEIVCNTPLTVSYN